MAQQTVDVRTASTGVLALACTAQFMVVLDLSVVNVALPSIQSELGFSEGGQQWIVSAYALAFAGFLLLGGRLADIFGRKRALILGLSLFSSASLAGGMTDAAPLLIIARALQGLGAAVLAPATLTIITTSFAEGPRRTRALATWTAVGIAGGTAGGLVGGLLTEYLSWRWTLLINVPIGAVTIFLAARFLARDGRRDPTRRLDVLGAVAATSGLTALTYGIAMARTEGWRAPATAMVLTGGILALALFVVVEYRFARTPLIPLRLFRLRAISAGNVSMLLAGASLVPMWYFLTLYMQKVLHYTPLQTGLGFLPHTLVAIVVGTRVTPWLMGRVEGRALIVVGALIAGIGFLWQSRMTADSSYLWGILGPAVVFSLGIGLLNTPITTAVTSGVVQSDAGAASGLMNTTKHFGGALGLATLVTIAGSHLDLPAALAADYGRAFLVTAAIMAMVAAVALLLPRRDS